jgi:NAD(P)-dependent dehydrogenase (short-subunit alcohol dehydrogenase family)
VQNQTFAPWLYRSDYGAQPCQRSLRAGASPRSSIPAMGCPSPRANKKKSKKVGATRFDFLVNNAGNSHRNMPFEKTTEEELDSIYNVHFKGVFFLFFLSLTMGDVSSMYPLLGLASARRAAPPTHQ